MAATEKHIPGEHSGSESPIDDKEAAAHVEQIHTNERVPGHAGYYEKDGLRTYGDDEDHDHEPPVRPFCVPFIFQFLTIVADDVPQSYVLGSDGISVDWVTGPCLHPRRLSALHIRRYRWCR
jgi:hypothetical protein